MAKFRSGAEEEAFFKLLEMPGEVMAALTIAFRTEQDPAIRTFLIKVAWQRGDRQAIDLLAEAVNESDEEIWQEALDGLLALASPEALRFSWQREHVSWRIDRQANDSSPTQRRRLNIFAQSSVANAARGPSYSSKWAARPVAICPLNELEVSQFGAPR